MASNDLILNRKQLSVLFKDNQAAILAFEKLFNKTSTITGDVNYNNFTGTNARDGIALSDLATFRQTGGQFATIAAVQAANLSGLGLGAIITLRGYSIEGIGPHRRIKVFAADAYTITSVEGSFFRLYEEFVTPQMFGEVNTGADGTTAAQLAVNYGALVRIPYPLNGGNYNWSTITIPGTFKGMIGDTGRGYGVVINHLGAGQVFKSPGTRVQFTQFENLVIIGNGGSTETQLFDLTGFSYSSFKNIWCLSGKLDGFYADGSNAATNQFSNNTFVHCRVESCGRDGWRFDSVALTGSENTANTFICCYGSSNGGAGFNELYGQSNNYIGCTAQGNALTDVFLGGSQSNFTGYTEGAAYPVVFGSASSKNSAKVRSSYPLWQTFIDNGIENIKSIGGEVRPEQHIFTNPYFTRWTGATPDSITKDAGITFGSYTDSESVAGFGLTISDTVTTNGVFLTPSLPFSKLAGKWVTLLLEMDTSGCTITPNFRVYTQSGAGFNTTGGECAIENLPITAAGQYITRAYDVKFAAGATAPVSVSIYPNHTGTAGAYTIKVRRASIVMGQTYDVSPFMGDATQPLSLANATLAAKANGVNIHRKQLGKTVFNATDLKIYTAQGTADVSTWKSADNATTVTPV